MTSGFRPPCHIQPSRDCLFYHTVTLPCSCTLPGDWDLRQDIDDYVGRYDMRDKIVVDVGCASGFISFEMEKRGARVIALDRSSETPLDEMGLVPFADYEGRSSGSLARAICHHLRAGGKYRTHQWLACDAPAPVG
jgi:SAM-dependent methyltransferase